MENSNRAKRKKPTLQEKNFELAHANLLLRLQNISLKKELQSQHPDTHAIIRLWIEDSLKLDRIQAENKQLREQLSIKGTIRSAKQLSRMEFDFSKISVN